MARILYLGHSHPNSTSAHRAEAIRRRGHSVEIRDPFAGSSGILGGGLENAIHYRTGYRFVQGRAKKWVNGFIKDVAGFDAVWIDSGELLGPAIIRQLKATGTPVILFNVDDPTGNRDGRRFDLVKKALPLYDLVAVVRKESEREAVAHGAPKVLLVWRSYDEVAHKPFDSDNDIPEKYRSDIAFIGTWMHKENRDEFLMELIDQQLPVSIWGGRWEKSPHWEKLKPFHRGGALGGRDYVAAIQGAKICLGLLSKGNRDLHTQRSLEVPYAKGLLCAERTEEHMELYQEWEEAVFWNDAKECAANCKKLLADDARRIAIRDAGAAKVRAMKLGNENIVAAVLQAAGVANDAAAGTRQSSL